MSRVVLENVTKRFNGVVAVEDLTLEIDQNTFFTFVGPSGCGKTTTMRMIAGLERPDEGRIWIGDRLVYSSADGTFVPASQRGVGLVFQNYALWPHMNVYDNITFGLQVKRTKRADIDSRARAVLGQLQIEELTKRYPNELSGGQQQRVALARELVSGADVILMDEPLSNLDARLRMDMRVELKRLHAESDKTIVYVTHDQLEALTLSTEIAVMKSGRVQQRGTPDDIYYRPQNRFVGEFLSLTPINWIEVEVTARGLAHMTLQLPLDASELGLPSLPHGTVLAMGLRPEFLMVTADPNDGALEGRVDTVLSAGPSKFVRVTLSDGTTTVPLTVQDYGDTELARGDRAFVSVEPSRVLWFDSRSDRAVSSATPAGAHHA